MWLEQSLGGDLSFQCANHLQQSLLFARHLVLLIPQHLSPPAREGEPGSLQGPRQARNHLEKRAEPGVLLRWPYFLFSEWWGQASPPNTVTSAGSESTSRTREPCVAGPPGNIPFGYTPSAVALSLRGSCMSEEAAVLPTAYLRAPCSMTHSQ